MAIQSFASVERHGAIRRSALLLFLSGLLLGLAPTPAIRAEAAQTVVGGPHAMDIAEAAHRFGIPAGWIVAVLGAESDGDPLAVSSAGAMGLMQLMPATWAEQRALHRLGDDPFQPRDNILAGTAYLRAMWDRYGNVGGMLAAYNFGPGRYDEYLAGERELPAETRDQVAALAPLLGGETTAPGTIAGTPRVIDWRDASLFVTAPADSEHALGQRGEWEVRDVQNVADVLVDPEGSLEKRNHWEKTSHSLLVGAILHVLYAEPNKTLAGVAAFLSDPRRTIEATLDAMMATRHLGQAGPHPVVASSARELLNKSDNERSGVLSTAMSFLGLYRDPVVAAVTSRCDWRIADLIADPKPSTLYLVVPPSDISRTKPLIRLVLNQIGRRLTEDLHARDRRHRVLLLLDEFPALGRLDFFESSLAFLAGYGIKSFLIAQSLNQIEKAYGQNNAILDNCHVRVSFATNDERTAKRVSDALGTATEMKAMQNYAGSRLAPWLGHIMVSRSETARQLLTPGEIMQLPPDDEIVMVAGSPPIRAKKAEDKANAGLRREPDMPGHVEIVHEKKEPAPEDEFWHLLGDDQEDSARQRQVMGRQMRGLARQVSMDANDGIDM